MKWYHESATYSDCLFCGGPSHMLHIAAKAQEFSPKGPEVIGLPRPYVKTREKNQIYDRLTPKNEGMGYEIGDRKLFKRIPMPWNSTRFDAQDIPNFAKDALDNSVMQSIDKKCCPMCGDRFEDNDKAVAWQPDKEDYFGSAGSGEFGSDTLPYHKECMRLVRIHCPHLRQISDDQFVEGNYSSLIDNVKRNTPWYFEASEKVTPNSENNSLEETPIYTNPSNAEILAAHYNGINLYDYVHARDSDINHNELLEAHNKGIDLSDYAYAKNSNLNKNEILDAHDKGINVGDYAYARGPVVTHDDVLKAHDKGACLRYYAQDRYSGDTHEEAIKKQIPGYNPWEKRKLEFFKKYNLASQPPEFEPGQEQPTGLPRPQHRTKPINQNYDQYGIKGVPPGARKLYQKVPVPWNSTSMDEDEDVPNFDKDSMGMHVNEIRSIMNNNELSSSEKLFHIEPMLNYSDSYRERCCPMCGGNFGDNDPAVRYKGSDVPMLSDHLPYHEHCMDLINKHCPHLRRDFKGNPNYFHEHGEYSNLLKNGVENYLKILSPNAITASQPPEFSPYEEQPKGLPRPQHRTQEENQRYWNTAPLRCPKCGSNTDEDDNEKIYCTGCGQKFENERKLYQKVPVPWNTDEIGNDIPEFNNDTINMDTSRMVSPFSYEDEEEPTEEEEKKAVKRFIQENRKNKKNDRNYSHSLDQKCCPMCGGKFEDNEPTALYEDSGVLDILSDWLPYHPHCMELVQKHCPHIRGNGQNSKGVAEFATGPYKEMLHRGILNHLKQIGNS